MTNLVVAAPIALPGGARAAELATGDNFSCARLQTGAVVCWGSNNDLINPSGSTGFMAPTTIPVTVASDGAEVRTAKAIAAGSRHLCILRDNGTVVCHGSNASFKLGRLASSPADVVRQHVGSFTIPPTSPSTAPLADVVKITAGGSHTCAVDAAGNVLCWGRWDGVHESLASLVPWGSGWLTGVVDIAAGGDVVNSTGADIPSRDHNCALRVDHTVLCWGTNADGQLGSSTPSQSSAALGVAWLEGGTFGPVLELAAGARHTCATTLTDRTFCWGADSSEQLSRTDTPPNTANPSSAQPVGGTSAPLVSVHALAAGAAFNCAVVSTDFSNDSFLKCWGANDVSQLGGANTAGAPLADPSNAFTPDLLCDGFSVITTPHIGPLIDSGHEHTCAFVSKSSCVSPAFGTNFQRGILCWGRNELTQVGNGVPTSTGLLPVFVPLAANLISLSVGGNHACAVDSLGRVFCWGSNNVGQCGISGVATVGTPSLVPWPSGLPAAVQVTTGDDFTCARLADATVACWGGNESGTLGREPYVTWDGIPAHAPTPVVPFGVGSGHATPSRVLCGCPGNVPLTDVKQVSAGARSVCALRSNGVVRCWGRNLRVGQGGPSSAILGCTADTRFCDPSANTPYPGISSIMPHASSDGANFGVSFTSTRVSMHSDGGCVVRPSGLAQCWGEWDSGRAGNGSIAGISQFVTNVQMIPSTGGAASDIRDVVALNGEFATKCALRTNGETWCWGFNNSGQAGRDPVPDIAVPRAREVRTSTSTILGGAIGISSGQFHSCAMAADNSISCWGRNSLHQSGTYGSDSVFARPIVLPL